MKDPIVEEVRKHRIEHTQKFGGDLLRIIYSYEIIFFSTFKSLLRNIQEFKML